MTQQQVKICPFAHVSCRQEKCALWVEVDTVTQGPIPEVRKRQVDGMCVFLAQLQAMGIIANRPPVVLGRAPIGRPAVGG